MFSSSVLAVSHRPQVRRLITTSSASRKLVGRFIAGDDLDTAIAPVRALVGRGMLVTVDHLGEDTADPADAVATRAAYVALLDRLDVLGLAHGGRGVGQALGARPGPARRRRAGSPWSTPPRSAPRPAAAGTTVTLDMEDHTTVDSTLGDPRGPAPRVPVGRRRGPVGAAPHRGRLPPTSHGRVRGCGWSRAPTPSRPRSRTRRKAEVDEAYLRCLQILLAGRGLPDGRHPRPAHDRGRPCHGRRARPQRRRPTSTRCSTASGPPSRTALAASGDRMRVYLPYGADWYGYFTRRLAERPANLGFFLRSLLSR